MSRKVTNLTFDACKINEIDPQGTTRIFIDLNTEYINEVLQDIDDQDIIDYATDKVLNAISVGEKLNIVGVEDVIAHYGVDELLDYIGMDTILKYINNTD